MESSSSSSTIVEAIESFSDSWLSSSSSETENINLKTTTKCSCSHDHQASTTSDIGLFDNSHNDGSFKFKMMMSSSSSGGGGGGVTDDEDLQYHTCYADELFSNGLLRRSSSTSNCSTTDAAVVVSSVDQQRAMACVCPPPPDDPVMLPPPPLFVTHHHVNVTRRPVVSGCKRRKSLLDQLMGSLRKCLLMPCHCGIIITRPSSFDQPRLSSPPNNNPWIHEFENPIYEAVLHCKRSSQ